MAPRYIAHLLNIKKKGNYSLRSNDSVMLEYPKGKFLRSLAIALSLWLPRNFGISFRRIFVTFFK